MTICIKKEWLLFVVGLSILTFGSRLLLLANIGTGGIDAFVMGVFRLLGGTLGLWIDIVSIMLVILGAFLRKSKVDLKAILTSLFLGLLYDTWGIILFNRIQIPKEEFIQGLVFLAGILIAPLGSAIYIHSNLSTSCVDYLMLSIKERFHLSMRVSRGLIEGGFVLGAAIVKGPIGIGTIMIMLLFGVFLQCYYKVIDLILKKNALYMHKIRNRRKTS